MTLRANLLAAGAAAAGAAVLALALSRLGIIAVAGIAACVAALWLMEEAGAALGLAVATVILCESGRWLAAPLSKVYDTVGPLHASPVELLVYLATAGVALRAARERRLRAPSGFGAALGLLGAAVVSGLITGRGAGGQTPIDAVRPLVGLLLCPLLVVNLVRTRRDLHLAAGALLIAVGVKAALGLALLASGSGAEQLDSTTPLTFYEPAANFLAMAVVLGALAAVLSRTHLSRWAWWIVPFALGSLTLSYRRSWWIATVAAAALVVVVASGRIGRRMLVPVLVVVAVAVAALLSSGVVVSGADSPVGRRISSLSPSKLRTNPEDRYRLDERRNVMAELRSHPVAGLGFGVGWQARYPLSVEHAGGRQYVHFAALWWWLNMGVLGLLAYVALLASGVITGLRVWHREGGRGLVAVIGVTSAVACVGLAIAETTATFLGKDPRMGLLVGCLAGLLSAAVLLPPPSSAPPAPRR